MRHAIGATDWERDDPFGDLGDVFQPADPIGPGTSGGGGGSGRTYTRILNPATDEMGTWTVRVRNHSQDGQQFIITVDHPETIQRLRETRVPFQLINRTFAQALLAMRLRIRIDSGQARVEFDRAFRELTGVEDQIVSVTDRLQDINLQEFKIEIGNEAGIPTIIACLDLEDRGDEIGVPGPNINADDLAIICRVLLAFGYPRGPDFFETAMLRENNQVARRSIRLFTYLDANPDINGLWVSFANKILTVTGPLGLTDESSIHGYVQAAIDDAEAALSSTLKKAAPYFQDVIMHLVNRDSVLFRIGADDDGMIVLHHRRPSIRDFLDDVSPDAGPVIDDEMSEGAAVVVTPVSPPISSLGGVRRDTTGSAAAHQNIRGGEARQLELQPPTA